MKTMLDGGQFTLDIDEDGRKFWRGGTPDCKDEILFDLGEALELHPDFWPVGTIVIAHEPAPEDIVEIIDPEDQGEEEYEYDEDDED